MFRDVVKLKGNITMSLCHICVITYIIILLITVKICVIRKWAYYDI